LKELTLYNTRTRCKEPFRPMEPGQVRVYTCGPTVYSPQHLGNMRPNLFADLLVRAFLAEGLEVTHVINVTDVGHLTQDDIDEGEDKMEVAARKAGLRAEEIAAKYTREWQADRTRLHCREPDVLCKATDHIPEQIAMIEKLEAKGVTYRIDDGIYFDTSKFPRYEEFARLDREVLRSGQRIGAVQGKRRGADFALWKFAPEGAARQQEWDSPWGRGFPGWHIECSAMSIKYLGERFDVHTGGVEHVKVHHTNEIAQSECALDVHPWVNVWMHEDWIVFQGEKMSKSLGNIATLQNLVDQGFLPLSFRFFFLQAHYRKQQNYHDEAMAAADRGYRRLLGQTLSLAAATEEANEDRLAPWQERFWEAVHDDLNAPRALAVAMEVARTDALEPNERRALLEEFDGWLGLELLTAELSETPRESDPRVDRAVAERETARASRDFVAADRIRDELLAEGIVIEDTPEGPLWRRK